MVRHETLKSGTSAMKTLWLAAATAAALLATPALAAGDLIQTPRMGTWGFDLAGRDMSVSPGQSLFDHANGEYMRRLTIPPERSTFGAWEILDDLNQARLRALVEAAAADTTAEGPRRQIGAAYRAFMDEARIESLGAQPLARELDAVRKARSRSDIARLMGATTSGFGQGTFNAAIWDDSKAPTRYAVYLFQGGITLPDRDYYLQPGFEPQRKAYQAYIAKMLTLANWPNPEAAAEAILAKETEIARVSWTSAQRRDDDKTYNPYTVAELRRLAPGFDWKAYLEGAGLGAVPRVVAAENTAFPKIAAIYGRSDMATLKAWLAFTIIDQGAPYLSKAFVDARFAFRGTALSGTQALRPRWKRGVAQVEGDLGEALGKLYVEAYFPARNKAAMEALVGDLKTAMGQRIRSLDWMGPETKTKALEKLSKFSVKIGYPDRWRDYSALKIDDQDAYGNAERAAAFEWNRRVARLNQPVDRAEWEMTPSTINAYYLSTKNEIVFPAAILQPPFFDIDGDPAVNYGAIGATIGHEITHGFDDQGRKSDGDGRLSEWWTPEDEAKFTAQAQKLGAQYSAVEVLPGAKINGDLTMGENIADLGGLIMALDAYKLSLKGRPAPVLDGLTGEQRVFLGYAQAWRSKYRDDLMRQILVSDPHSPPQARVDLPVRNIDAFYEAFGVKPGDPMYIPPEARARIW